MLTLIETSNLNAAEPSFRWEGFHIGLNTGYAWNTDHGSENCNLPGDYPCRIIPAGSTAHVNSSGFIGGAQIGFKQQFDQVVLGFETDIQGSGISASKSINIPNPSILGASLPNRLFQASQQTDLLGTVRTLLGVALLDKTLVYATGGFAYANVKTSATYTSIVGGSYPIPGGGAIIGSSFTGTVSDTPIGWVMGGGVEYAISDQFSAKFEGLYYDLGAIQLTENRTSAPLVLLSGPTPNSYLPSKTFEINGPILRIGLNYHF